VAGIREVAIRIAHHLLGTVIVVLDGDVDRHVRRLPPTSLVSVAARDAATAEATSCIARTASPLRLR
jgi:uncharacterized FlaG/YvyC family protein